MRSARARRVLVSVVAVGLGANLLVPSLLASSKSAPLRGSELSPLASTAYGPVLVVGGGALNDFPSTNSAGTLAGDLAVARSRTS